MHDIFYYIQVQTERQGNGIDRSHEFEGVFSSETFHILSGCFVNNCEAIGN
jgi:hypothetical protein